MVKSHSCTEGFLMFASNAPTAGACVLGCGPGDNCAEGGVAGIGIVTGNPVEILAEGLATNACGTTQPVVAVAGPCPVVRLGVGIFTRQFKRNPGIFPAIAVTWNVDSVSKSQEYPARTEVLLSGDHAIPIRGPTEPILPFLNQRSAFTYVTVPCDPSGKTLGTRACLAS